MRRCKKCQPMTFSWVKGTWIHLLCSTQLFYHFFWAISGHHLHSSWSWQVDPLYLCDKYKVAPEVIQKWKNQRGKGQNTHGYSTRYCSHAHARHHSRTRCNGWHLTHNQRLLTALRLYAPVMQTSWAGPPAESKTLPKTADIHLAISKWQNITHGKAIQPEWTSNQQSAGNSGGILD